MQAARFEIPLNETGFREHFLTLTESQQQFARLVYRWCQTPRKMLMVVSGGPGTGKSYVVKKVLDQVYASQVRMSYTARNARDIAGHTIHSTLKLDYKGFCGKLEKQLKNEPDLVTSIKKSGAIMNELTCDQDPFIVVIDEVSMINGWLMYWILRFFMDRTSKPLLFIAIGDPHQLNPVQSPHNLFSFSFTETKWSVRQVHLKETKRFTPEYEAHIDALRDYVNEASEAGLFAYLCLHFPVFAVFEESMLARVNRAMASTNDRVDAFNAYYLKHMVTGREIQIEPKLSLKRGCIVFVTKNGCSSVTNGTELEFVRYSKSKERIICKNPKTDEKVSIRKDFESKRFPVVLGFAATIHKFQGGTIDQEKIIIHFDGIRNLNMTYTAVSRVRDMRQIVGIFL